MLTDTDLTRLLLNVREYLIACAEAATRHEESKQVGRRLFSLADFDPTPSELSDRERRLVVVYLVAAANCAADFEVDPKIADRLRRIATAEAEIYGEARRAARRLLNELGSD